MRVVSWVEMGVAERCAWVMVAPIVAELDSSPFWRSNQGMAVGTGAAQRERRRARAAPQRVRRPPQGEGAEGDSGGSGYGLRYAAFCRAQWRDCR
ncbi:hypothetical protein ACINB_25170 [Acidovorax sp. NB1]|nr:hypothetical protein ACINB_25170 [Acidovorax sp. NB1]